MTYHWDFHTVGQYLDLFVWGVVYTVLYTTGSIVIGVVLGALACAARLS
jgi:polar amino acid transport system permease protein